MSNSFHHSSRLSYLWRHLLPVDALCFRATMLFLCRDNNHKAGKQWNVPHLSCVTQHLLTVLTASLPSSTCQVHLWRGRLWVSSSSKLMFVIMFLFLSVAQGELRLLSLIQISISNMQMCDLHRRLAQLSSQTWKKTSQQQTRRLERCHTWKETDFVTFSLWTVWIVVCHVKTRRLFLTCYYSWKCIYWSQSSVPVQSKVISELSENRNGFTLFSKVKSWLFNCSY